MSADTKHNTPTGGGAVLAAAAFPAAAPPPTTTTIPVMLPGYRPLSKSDEQKFRDAVLHSMALDRLLDMYMLWMYPKDYALRLARAQEPLVVGDHSVQLGRLNVASPAVQEFLTWEMGSGGAANPRRMSLLTEVVFGASGVELELLESWYSVFGSSSRGGRAKGLPVYDAAASKAALDLIAFRRQTIVSLSEKVQTAKQATKLLDSSGFHGPLLRYLPMGTVEVIFRDTLKSLPVTELRKMYRDTYGEIPEECTAVQILETLRRGTGIVLSDVFHGPSGGQAEQKIWADAAWHLARENSRAEAAVLSHDSDSATAAIATVARECYGVTEVTVVGSSSSANASTPTIINIANPALTPGAAAGQLPSATDPDVKFHSYQAGVVLKLILLWREASSTHYFAVPDANYAWRRLQVSVGTVTAALHTKKGAFNIHYEEWSRGYENTIRDDLAVNGKLSLDPGYVEGFTKALEMYSESVSFEAGVYSDLLMAHDQLVAVKNDAYSRGFIFGWQESELKRSETKKKADEAVIRFSKDFRAEVVEQLPLALNPKGEVQQTWKVKNIGTAKWTTDNISVASFAPEHYDFYVSLEGFPVSAGNIAQISAVFKADVAPAPASWYVVEHTLGVRLETYTEMYGVEVDRVQLRFGPVLKTSAHGPLAAIVADLKSKADKRAAAASATAASLAEQASADAKAAADAANAAAAAQAAAAAEASKKAQADQTAAAKAAADQAAADAVKAAADAEVSKAIASAVETLAAEKKSKADAAQKKAAAVDTNVRTMAIAAVQTAVASGAAKAKPVAPNVATDTKVQAAAAGVPVSAPVAQPPLGADGSLQKADLERADALLDKFSAQLWYAENVGRSTIETTAQKFVFENAVLGGLDKKALKAGLGKDVKAMPLVDKKTQTPLGKDTVKQSIARVLGASDAKEIALVDDGYATGEAAAKSVTTHEAYRDLFNRAEEKVPKDNNRRGVALWRYGFMAGAAQNLLRQTYPQMRVLTYPMAVEEKVPGVVDDAAAGETFRLWFVNVYKYGEVNLPGADQRRKKRNGLFQLYEVSETGSRLRDDITPDAAFQIADAIQNAVVKNKLKSSYDGPTDATDEFRQIILQLTTRSSFAKRDNIPKLQELATKMAQEVLAIGQKTPNVKMTWDGLVPLFKEFHAATKGSA